MKTLKNNAEKKDSLIFRTSKHINYNGTPSTIYVEIRLNDACRNGHQDFAITGDIYSNQTGNKADRYHIAGGCIHEEIQKYFKEFTPFIHLHLCDFAGVPMYPASNGFYHLTVGFNNTKPNDDNFKLEFCDYYRISESQFAELNKSIDTIDYFLKLETLGILKQWKKEATEAIKQLEKLTGVKFLNNSKRSQLDEFTAEQIEDFKQKLKEGYFTEEAQREREAEKLKIKIAELETKRAEKIEIINNEININIFLLKTNLKAYNNFIFYNHTNTVSFNWQNYKPMLTIEEFNILKEQIQKEFKNINIEMHK